MVFVCICGQNDGFLVRKMFTKAEMFLYICRQILHKYAENASIFSVVSARKMVKKSSSEAVFGAFWVPKILLVVINFDKAGFMTMFLAHFSCVF